MIRRSSPLQQGVEWRVNGMFKLAHVIDLKQIQNIIDKTTEETSVVTDTRVASLICHYLEKATNGITRMTSAHRRACQLAKASVVNTNLLGQKEVETLLAETRSLPYQNVVEAVEFAEPSILTNGTCLLYVLALPKVVDTKYKLMLLYPTITESKQVVLEYNRMAMDPQETYAVLGNCLSIGNTTVCQKKKLRETRRGELYPQAPKRRTRLLRSPEKRPRDIGVG